MGLRHKNLTRRTHQYWHVLFFAAVVAALALTVHGLGRVLTPIMAALILSYLIDPLVTACERKLKLPRSIGTLLVFLVGVLVVFSIVLFLVPLLKRELKAFAEALPGYIQRVQTELIPWVEQQFGITLPHTTSELIEQFGADLKGATHDAMGSVGGVAKRVAKSTGAFFSTLGTVLLVPVFIFYFLPKFPRIVEAARELIPHRFRPWVDGTAKEIDRALAAWIRGQITVMFVLATFYAVGLSVLGVKMAVLIGVLTGMLAFIPYVGFGIGVVLAFLMCILEYKGPGQLIGVAATFGTIQVLEGLVLTPRLVGDKVGLGPVGVLIALLFGGNLFGFVGVLIAVPVAAALAVILRRGITSYKDSVFYRKGAHSLEHRPSASEITSGAIAAKQAEAQAETVKQAEAQPDGASEATVTEPADAGDASASGNDSDEESR